ncbi:MAG TPA: long-chain fatty acid--CoA ligase [Gemmatimonadales bacterium]|nr:long-chain fatty acid--CoA ligase [Gemmatimonadales bacterium]
MSATLNHLFFDAVSAHRSLPAALRHKAGGEWVGITHDELRDRVRAVSAALAELGISPGDRIAILSENRPEWAITDYACLTGRYVDVPVYPTLPAAQVAYVIRNSGSRVAFCSTRDQLAKLREARAEMPALEHVVVFDGDAAGSGAIAFSEFEANGAAAAALHSDWQAQALEALPDDLATLIYTSGTTGEPKGVMLSHGNIASNVAASLQVLELHPGQECLSFLPLSHIFERMVGHYTMLSGGVIINYATNFDSVAAEIIEVRPHLLASVPRLYEKIFARVQSMAVAGGSLRRSIFEWASATADKALEYRLEGRALPILLRIGLAVADLLVFRKLRARLGGKFEFAVSGGAPLNPAICRFFLAAGIPILEGYGLTETSPVISVNRMEKIKPGTVGPPIPGVEIAIADDGEILTRGPNLMKGYYQLPEATAEAIDSDGWFHTGDIGQIDADGYLRITDRKKDLIVTAGGKNIAPQPIEALLKTSDLLSNAVLLGDRRPYPIMVLVPNFAALEKWAEHKGIKVGDRKDFVELPEVRDKLEREARRLLRNLAHFETPKKFLITPSEFSIDGGELTPKLSVRRKVVEQKWAAEIEALYNEPQHP